jgi:hypothetical protein
MGKIRSLVLGVALSAAILAPSAARASSCSIATVAGQPGGCIYKATDAGQYRAITTSGWQISISHEGAPFQVVLAARQVSCLAPPINAVSTGSIPSVAGDMVKLEVRSACFHLAPGGGAPPMDIRYENGFIAGGDGAAAGVPEPPSTAHGDPTNSCVARDIAVVTTGSMTCTYTAAYASGQVIQATPNHIDITYTDPDGSVHTVYHQGSASLPGRGTFSQPIGATMVVTVGPDTASGPVAGSVGIVIAGDF